jgi:hypothetical protein
MIWLDGFSELEPQRHRDTEKKEKNVSKQE